MRGRPLRATAPGTEGGGGGFRAHADLRLLPQPGVTHTVDGAGPVPTVKTETVQRLDTFMQRDRGAGVSLNNLIFPSDFFLYRLTPAGSS